MTEFFPTDAQMCDEDLLWAAASIDRSLAGLRAEQFVYLRDFLVRHGDDPQVVALAGREQMVRYGGAGSPEIPEFAVAQVRAEMGLSLWAAQRLVADVLSLIYRLPKVFAAMLAGDVDEYRARMAASATRQLSLDQVARIDERLTAGYPDRDPLVARMSRKRLNHLIAQIVGVEGPDSAEEQVAAALAGRDVTIRPGPAGVADLSGSLSEADGARLQQRLAQVVGWLGELSDTRSKRVRRSVALGMLADPTGLDQLYARVQAHRRRQNNPGHGGDNDRDDSSTAPVPATVLYIHYDRASQTWSLDGTGPLTTTEAQHLVGHSHVTVKPVLDLAQNLSYTGYVAGPRLKEQLRLMNAGLCPFPYCDQPAWEGDYDHNTNYDPNAPPGAPGATDTRNGARLCRHDHRVKTHSGWTVESPTPGTWLWHGPRGDHYLVTAGTTTRLHT